jgi:hypothetical protein
MTPFEQARKIFSNFPEEVFSLWLDERIRQYGWPPGGDAWDRTLVGYPLLYWRKLIWVEKEVPLAFDLLGPLSRRTVNGLMAANVLGKPDASAEAAGDTPLNTPGNSKERFYSIFKHVVEKWGVPGKLVLLDEGGYCEILAGCHRMAVVCAMRQFPEFRKYVPGQFRCWVASLDPQFKKLFGK